MPTTVETTPANIFQSTSEHHLRGCETVGKLTMQVVVLVVMLVLVYMVMLLHM